MKCCHATGATRATLRKRRQEAAGHYSGPVTNDQPAASDPITGRSSLAVVAAFATASLLGFLLLGIVARWLPKEVNAQFLAIWGLVFGFGSALSAVEQEIVRVATRARLAGTKVPARAWQVTAIAVVVALVVLSGVVLVPGIGTVLRTSATVLLLSFVAVGGFAVMGMSRGVLLGTGQMGRYVFVVAGEAVFRAVLAIAFYLWEVTPSLELATCTIVIGSFGWVPVARAIVRTVDWGGRRDRVGNVAATVGTLGLGNGLAALLITGFPALVTAVTGTTAGLATLFGAVTLSRLPLIALTPLQALAVPVATRLVAEDRGDELRRLVGKIGAIALAAATVLGVTGWFAGPWALRIYMGPAYQAAPWMMAVLLAASCVMAAAMLQVAALVAMERYSDVVLTWVVADLCAVLMLTIGPGTTETSGALAFAFGSTLAWLVSAQRVLRGVTGPRQ